jgi:hypothetical protein
VGETAVSAKEQIMRRITKEIMLIALAALIIALGYLYFVMSIPNCIDGSRAGFDGRAFFCGKANPQ